MPIPFELLNFRSNKIQNILTCTKIYCIGGFSRFCENILKDTGVALLPGSDFGFDKSKMLARLSFTDFDGQNFMNETKNTKKIDNNLIFNFAPKIVEGVEKLKKWSESV